MKTNLYRLFAVLVAILMVFSMFACSGNAGGNDKPADATVADDIVNGDFEDVASGQWVGWTRKDAAFNFRGVTDVEKISGAPIEKSGTYQA